MPLLLRCTSCFSSSGETIFRATELADSVNGSWLRSTLAQCQCYFNVRLWTKRDGKRNMIRFLHLNRDSESFGMNPYDGGQWSSDSEWMCAVVDLISTGFVQPCSKTFEWRMSSGEHIHQRNRGPSELEAIFCTSHIMVPLDSSHFSPAGVNVNGHRSASRECKLACERDAFMCPRLNLLSPQFSLNWVFLTRQLPHLHILDYRLILYLDFKNRHSFSTHSLICKLTRRKTLWMTLFLRLAELMGMSEAGSQLCGPYIHFHTAEILPNLVVKIKKFPSIFFQMDKTLWSRC